MKNETARREIESLDYYLQNHTNDYSEESHTAMMMAVKALEQQPCEDCISRESLRQKLQEHHDFFVNAYGNFRGMSLSDKIRVDEIINCIAMVVNEPSVTPQQTRWIPVSKELPPIAQRVCVSATNGEVFIARYHSFDKWTFEPTGISYAYNKDSIVAWQPLPQSYKAESEE